MLLITWKNDEKIMKKYEEPKLEIIDFGQNNDVILTSGDNGGIDENQGGI